MLVLDFKHTCQSRFLWQKILLTRVTTNALNTFFIFHFHWTSSSVILCALHYILTLLPIFCLKEKLSRICNRCLVLAKRLFFNINIKKMVNLKQAKFYQVFQIATIKRILFIERLATLYFTTTKIRGFNFSDAFFQIIWYWRCIINDSYNVSPIKSNKMRSGRVALDANFGH